MDRRKVVFTNGCFDLLHPGHLTLLEFCASLGSVVVGLNSDSSVRQLKGPTRPVVPEHLRKYALEACRWVDRVIVFEEETPITLIEELRPDIIVKGDDYKGYEIVGQELAHVELFPRRLDYSTSALIEKIRGL